MIRIEGQVDRVVRRKSELERENAVLIRENERLRNRVAELSAERDLLDKRIRLSTRRIESAFGQLQLIAEDN